MIEHVRNIKSKIDANICHKKGKGIRTHRGVGYPFDGPLIPPPSPVIKDGTGVLASSRLLNSG